MTSPTSFLHRAMPPASDDIAAELCEKVRALHRLLRAHSPLIVAYSGGVDSTYLLAAAHSLLGGGVLGVIADSPSLPRRALIDALAVAQQIGACVEVIQTTELANPDYTNNPLNRCYFCKAELFAKLDRLAKERRFRAIAYGENMDDARQIRPGREAAAQFSVIAPLKDCRLTKAEIRELSRGLGLPTADAPAQPCLSSRIPHGTPVTTAALAMIEKAELFVRELGFRIFRVRHIVAADGTLNARLQVAPEEMSRAREAEAHLEARLRTIGYAEVEIDPAGYRTAA